MREEVTDEDAELLGELGVDTGPVETGGRTAREQRIIAGFEEIERFVEEHGRLPEHGETRDIFERLYAVRLDRIRESAECREALRGLDSRGLLQAGAAVAEGRTEDEPTDEDLLNSLGVTQAAAGVADLVHVRSRDEIKAAEEIAQRNPCLDFAQFKPVFETVQSELEAGKRQTVKYQDNADVMKGDLFILDGQKVLVAEMGEPFVSDYGRPDRRLRVVYDNGTESDLLVRSLQRALNKDKTSRRITEPGFGPLFSDQEEEGDLATGYIYVLRSKLNHPLFAEHGLVVHKIGLTKSEVKQRVSNAKKETTYLLAEIEIAQTYKLSNIDPKRLETLLHRFFGQARLDLALKDRFGLEVEPREWFLVPLPAIEDAVGRIMDGTIGDFRYDPETACVVRRE